MPKVQVTRSATRSFVINESETMVHKEELFEIRQRARADIGLWTNRRPAFETWVPALSPTILPNQRHERAGAMIFSLVTFVGLNYTYQTLRFASLTDGYDKLAAAL